MSAGKIVPCIGFLDESDGIQGREFNSNAYFKSRFTGEFYFGGVNGMNVFKPEAVVDDPRIPPVVFTEFQYYPKQDKEGQSLLIEGITHRQEITLLHRENTFSVEFAALNYHKTKKSQYAYRLGGVNAPWIQLGTKREVSFTNLAPGNYTLHVKGSNGDGVWNEEGASLNIRILLPWWLTWGPRGLYLLAILAILYSLYAWRTRR